uniref:Protein kinase domain-containing protein n=1 Tax=Chenopodium quinoa TaxID=63459 RepID=A0A803M5A3_CHEQI
MPWTGTLTFRPRCSPPPPAPSTSTPTPTRPTSSEPDFLRNVQAAFKRHRSIGTMQSTNLLPRRSVLPQRETPKSSVHNSGLTVETKRSVEIASQPKNLHGHTNERSSVIDPQEDASLTPPSFTATITNTYDDKYNPFGGHIKEDQLTCKAGVDINVSCGAQSKHCQMVEGSRKVKFSLASSANSQGTDGQMATRMDLATRLDNLSSHMDSLALTEMEWEAVNQAEISNVINNEPKLQDAVSADADGCSRGDGGSSVLAVRMSSLQNQLHHLRDFLHNDVSHPMTQSSVVGSSCVTTTSVHATSAPMLNSTTHSSCPHQDSSAVGSLTDANRISQNIAVRDGTHQACPTSVNVSGVDADRALSGAQASSSATNSLAEVKEIQQHNLQQAKVPADPPQTQSQPIMEKGQGADASHIPPPSSSSKDLSSNVKLEPSKSEKHEKAPSRKKGYDPDLFFKVNGKLYQRLGKIGSGGSSEVHKVISSDCTIYALKKIKLKGRDYATAYGFCQEILYLKKLKGKDNIIQLIDFEVTDKALLHEVMNGSISNKDSRVKDDGYIYMVLEYGEIDLAHMLSHKWREIEGTNSTMDQNWLRFYWQQILQAVNTIHEERIVHSDLKPANFLLVKGSLKLIDFGIAKAIMSDTTNIQRDAQVGTLSYMSPEAFMCNESDANGNTIKCGRPSDIWSLGCILYQMVYGRTPFSEYKTFWAKFKVITDPSHEITYGPVSNPWLLDLMKKCLAWNRNERWRIPELLEHPFLVPPIQQQLPPTLKQHCKFTHENVPNLCSEFQQLLEDPAAISRDNQFRILSQISCICQQLQEHLTKMS